jgi:hypothetical protein
LAIRAPSEQQICHIGTANEQQNGHRAKKQLQYGRDSFESASSSGSTVAPSMRAFRMCVSPARNAANASISARATRIAVLAPAGRSSRCRIPRFLRSDKRDDHIG